MNDENQQVKLRIAARQKQEGKEKRQDEEHCEKTCTKWRRKEETKPVKPVEEQKQQERRVDTQVQPTRKMHIDGQVSLEPQTKRAKEHEDKQRVVKALNNPAESENLQRYHKQKQPAQGRGKRAGANAVEELPALLRLVKMKKTN